MTNQGHVLTAVRASFEREPRINLHKYPVRMDFSDGALTLEGEAETWQRRNCPWNSRLPFPEPQHRDRLHVTPSTDMGDGAILDAVRDASL